MPQELHIHPSYRASRQPEVASSGLYVDVNAYYMSMAEWSSSSKHVVIVVCFRNLLDSPWMCRLFTPIRPLNSRRGGRKNLIAHMYLPTSDMQVIPVRDD